MLTLVPLPESLPSHRGDGVDANIAERDPHLVSWSSPIDPGNPKNWSLARKWAATAAVSLFTFISPVASSMVTPALKVMASELKMESDIETQMPVPIFVLAYAVGPLCFGPISETFGRTYVLQSTNLLYIVWNLACGFAQTKGQLFGFRFMSGIAGSAPLAVGGGVLRLRCWNADQRGQAVGIYTLAPLLGPVIGPITGAFISEYTTWRWVFWSTSIAGIIIQVFGFLFLPETYGPILLKRRAKSLRENEGESLYHTEHDSVNFISAMKTALVRPFKLLATQPIVQSTGIGGLNYISLGIGYVLGAQVNTHTSDKIYRRLKSAWNNEGVPEFRMPAMFVGFVFIPIGHFWYGWSVQARVHWVMPNIGMVIFGFGAIMCLQCMQTYIIDSYARFAASGLAAAVVLRSLAGFAFPLFAPYMYQSLGYGWGNSVLGFLSIVIGIPAPFLFWFFGAKLRGMSRYAAG
ncbi:major facilitator superfamily domain-containing protein [Aspergillus insuetus]